MKQNKLMAILAKIMFSSRWLQAPLYLGLVIILVFYVYTFGIGLIHLILSVDNFDKITAMVEALDLIDVVMIANLIIMVIVGGYEVFVSDLNIREHPDHPEWLDEVDAGTMKVKLALSLVTISSIQLLRSFIDPAVKQQGFVMWQVFIHLTLIVSAIGIAFTNNLMSSGKKKNK